MPKEFIKITFQDLEIAENFFDNEKHFSEFILAVVSYYRGKNYQIKTKIVSKYFETYKKTMDHILKSKQYGFKGYEQKLENQINKNDTLKGVHEDNLKTPFNQIINNKIISNNNKVININNKIYSKIVDFWLKEFKVDYVFSAKDGKKVKSIISQIEKKLKLQNKEITEETVLESFKWVCINLPEFYKTQDLSVIDSKFNAIVEEIKSNKNGISKNKQQLAVLKAAAEENLRKFTNQQS